MAENMDVEMEDQVFEDEYEKGCGCKAHCMSLFPKDVIREQYLALQELSKEEKDLILIGQIRAQR